MGSLSSFYFLLFFPFSFSFSCSFSFPFFLILSFFLSSFSFAFRLSLSSTLISLLYKMSTLSRGKRRVAARRDVSQLLQAEVKRKYQEAVHRKLTPLVGNSPIATNARYQQIKIALTEAANEVLPRAPSRIRGKLRHFDDVVIDRLSNRQLNLTESIYNRSRSQQKNKRLRRKRSRIFKQIRKRMQQLTEAKVEQLATEMEQANGNRRAFEIARVLTKHQN